MNALYDKLKVALQELAASATEQEENLAKLHVGPDELALELDAYAGAAINLVEAGRLSPTAFDAVCELHRHLAGFSGAHNADEWTISALRTSANWAVARTLASKALALMRE